MNTQELTKHVGRTLLGVIAMLGIGLALSSPAQAQSSENPNFNKDARNSESITAQQYREAELKSHFNQIYQYRYMPFSYGTRPGGGLEAKLKVTNHSSNEIRFVSWVVSFTDPITGALISTREVTSKSKIAPGKEKTLKKTLAVPRLVRVSAKDGKAHSVLPKMTSALTNVTYADGTTSTTP
jgi:hypothetical protein